MQHGILGPGGIGGLIGAVLSQAGHDVTLLVRPGTESAYPSELKLESPFSATISAPVHIGSPAPATFDVLWITVKATELDSALHDMLSRPEPRSVIPLLNGIDHMQKLRHHFGDNRVIAATIFVESERVAPGRIIHRSPFARLRISSSGQRQIGPAIDDLANFGFDCGFIPDEATLLWNKLAFLAPVALSTTSWNCPIGDVLNDLKRAAEVAGSVWEACRVATAYGAKVDAAHVLSTIEGLPPTIRSSMDKDVSAGRLPELDAIAGPILRGGRRFGIAVEVTQSLAARVDLRSSALGRSTA